MKGNLKIVSVEEIKYLNNHNLLDLRPNSFLMIVSFYFFPYNKF